MMRLHENVDVMPSPNTSYCDICLRIDPKASEEFGDSAAVHARPELVLCPLRACINRS